MEKLTISNLSFFQNELKGFVRKRVKDKAVADDILQDVFLKVHARIHQLHESEKITAWIYQITKNTIVDHFRRAARAVAPSELYWQGDAPNFNACVAGYLKELLPTLPHIYGEALRLIDIENLSQLELAERLGMSYSGAKSRVQRARQMLREKVYELLIVETDAYGNVTVCSDRTSCC